MYHGGGLPWDFRVGVGSLSVPGGVEQPNPKAAWFMRVCAVSPQRHRRLRTGPPLHTPRGHAPPAPMQCHDPATQDIEILRCGMAAPDNLGIQIFCMSCTLRSYSLFIRSHSLALAEKMHLPQIKSGAKYKKYGAGKTKKPNSNAAHRADC